MNKYQEDFEMVTKLNPLSSRERTILNYGIEYGREKAIDDFAEKLKAEYDNNMRIPEIEVVFAKAIVEQVKGQLKGGAEE